ncbi:MAG: hypothetical protein WD733_06465, partial [Bryobacterales bacterium]
PEGAAEMAQTFAQIFLHILFSTKERRASLNEAWRNELFAYVGVSSEASTLKGQSPSAPNHPIDHGSTRVTVPFAPKCAVAIDPSHGRPAMRRSA